MPPITPSTSAYQRNALHEVYRHINPARAIEEITISSGKDDKLLIAVCVVGGVLGFVLVTMLAAFCWRKYQRHRQEARRRLKGKDIEIRPVEVAKISPPIRRPSTPDFSARDRAISSDAWCVRSLHPNPLRSHPPREGTVACSIDSQEGGDYGYFMSGGLGPAEVQEGSADVVEDKKSSVVASEHPPSETDEGKIVGVSSGVKN
ncbi:hypothetical protein F4779DRAFT_624486 [Xylariaceae sp. FL0662B]|nr:hypothetical protein F4779DRAFT_624486 [Xylariaceae sp. FL0662B]